MRVYSLCKAPNIKLEHINRAVISCCQDAFFSSRSFNWILRRVTARWELLLVVFPLTRIAQSAMSGWLLCPCPTPLGKH